MRWSGLSRTKGWCTARQEGFRGLFSGLGPRLLRFVPNIAVAVVFIDTALIA
jgi:hypothetical protein